MCDRFLGRAFWGSEAGLGWLSEGAASAETANAARLVPSQVTYADLRFVIRTGVRFWSSWRGLTPDDLTAYAIASVQSPITRPGVVR